MYQIICDDNIIHDVRVEGLQVIDAKCTLEVNKTGSLTFSVPPTHPNYDDIHKHTSTITVLRDGEVVFIGRVLNDEIDFYNIKNIECEGELAYLLDSVQRIKQYNLTGTNSIKNYLEDIISIHNSQMHEARKQFVVGNVTVVHSSGAFTPKSDFETTLNAINDKLLGVYGGYILTRHSGDTTYIDYVSEYSGVCEQTIEFGKNLIDMTRYINGADVFTALIPTGATASTEEMDNRLNITSVADGTYGDIVKSGDYIYNSVGVKKWGWIWKAMNWGDINVASELFATAKSILENSIDETFSMELTAIDLNLLDVNVDTIKIGNKIQCISLPHGINELMFVSGMTIDIDKPQNTIIKLALPKGQSFATGDTTITDTKKEVTDIKKLIDEDYPTNSEVDNKFEVFKDWVDDNYCAKDIDGNIDLSRYALISDVNDALTELAFALQGV